MSRPLVWLLALTFSAACWALLILGIGAVVAWMGGLS